MFGKLDEGKGEKADAKEELIQSKQFGNMTGLQQCQVTCISSKNTTWIEQYAPDA